MTQLAGVQRIAPSFSDRCKRAFLGRPMITDQLQHERLSKPVALGVLSPDAISSTAYGSEQVMIELLPAAGLAGAFALLLPITGVILLILVLVAASYRQVVMVYTRSGGSYIVARENFGPKIAQIAAASLLIDYVVTVAVQCAAGTVAVVSAIPVLGPYSLEITVGVVLIMCFANLRGLREAGLSFALPTYLFVGMVSLTIVVGVIREFFGGLPLYHPELADSGSVSVGQGSGQIMGATVLIVLRAFANGGSSLTGVEAISNTVNSFRKPEGVNARKVLTVMACVLAFLLAGVAWLAHITHAFPYAAGYPSMLSEIARAVFGDGVIGKVLYFLVQAATALILYTGGNTSFNGFPALTSFVAEDSFLPRPLMKRGQRLVFSNGIITLTVLAVVLLIGTGGSLNALVPFYAIGVFTGFSMAGYGMTKHWLTHRGPGWRSKLAINLSAGILSTVVVGIFAIAKFTEGAWLVVIVFPILVFALMRVNRQYRAEASVLKMSLADSPDLAKYERHRVLIFVDSVDLAEVEAMRYAKGLHADELTAVHFVLDSAHAARLRRRWQHFGHVSELRTVDCLDRNLSRAAQDLVLEVMQEHADTKVTVLLPRREYSQLLGRLLHDRTADKIAGVVSRIPGASAQIVAYDIATRIALATLAEQQSPAPSSGADDRTEFPEPERAHANGLTPQVVDSGGK